jgi:hypothetical protein
MGRISSHLCLVYLKDIMILKQENESLRVVLNADGSAQIEDKIGGSSWRMAAIAYQEEGAIDNGHVWQRTGRSSCEQFAGRFHLEVENENVVRCTLLDELRQPLGDFRVRIVLDASGYASSCFR